MQWRVHVDDRHRSDIDYDGHPDDDLGTGKHVDLSAPIGAMVAVTVTAGLRPTAACRGVNGAVVAIADLRPLDSACAREALG